MARACGLDRCRRCEPLIDTPTSLGHGFASSPPEALVLGEGGRVPGATGGVRRVCSLLAYRVELLAP